MNTVAVIGGGPAGAMAAAEMASAGLRVTLFDEKLAWEKPCGGGVTFKAYHEYPFLVDNNVSKRTVRQTWIDAPDTTGARLDLDRPILIYARRDLNQLLLDRAVRCGAGIEQARVLDIERDAGGRWSIRTRTGAAQADFCIVATGARNPLRSAGTEWTADDTMVALGYHMPSDQQHIDVAFLKGLEGYVWNFPRCGHSSVGICGKGEAARALRARLERYMVEHGMDPRQGQFYAHMLPALAPRSWKRNRVQGDGWLAVGDAAGLVDPITGEGIYYAIRSGDLAARAVVAERPETYAATIECDFGGDLHLGSLLASRIYTGRFLFARIPTRMAQFTRYSPSFRAVMQDLFAGTQGYHDLGRRLWRNLAATLGETAIRYLKCTFPNPKPYSNAPGS